MFNITSPTGTSRRSVALCSVVSLALSVAACGSDDEAAETTSAETTSAETTSAQSAPAATSAAATIAAAAEFDLATYCAAEVELEHAGATGDPEEDPVGFAEAVLAKAGPARAAAPQELVETFDAAIAALEETIETGNPEPIFAVDTTLFHTYDLANCGWNEASVSMQDYHFMGLPETLPVGVTSLEVTNDGAEAHVMIIAAKKDGVTASWEEIFSSPEGESMVDTIGSAFAAPGATGYTVVDLAAGEYMALCPIPQGTTMDTEGSGAPHFTLGMQHLITVA